MTYSVVRSERFERDVDEFAAYAADYSEEFARRQFERLNRVFTEFLAESPGASAMFYATGAPYRGYLFRVGRRTAYWIIYQVDEEARRVEVLRFWNTARDPDAFET